MILAMPIRRGTYYLGKLTGFICVAGLIALFFSLLLFVYADPVQVIIWMLSLLMELILVVALSLVMLFTFNQVPSALTGVFIIYGASRIVTSIYLMAKYPIIAHTTIAQKFMDSLVAVLTWVLPDLHRYTQTSWLTYKEADWSLLLPLLGQTSIYLVFLSFIALFDFYRKNF
jgi:hypothetical protein